MVFLLKRQCGKQGWRSFFSDMELEGERWYNINTYIAFASNLLVYCPVTHAYADIHSVTDTLRLGLPQTSWSCPLFLGECNLNSAVSSQDGISSTASFTFYGGACGPMNQRVLDYDIGVGAMQAPDCSITLALIYPPYEDCAILHSTSRATL